MPRPRHGTATVAAHRRSARADTLSVMARRARPARLFRPALTAYEASLALVQFGRRQGEYRRPEGPQGFPRRRAHDRCRQFVAACLRQLLRGSGQDGHRLFAVRHRRRRRAQGDRAEGRQICVEGLEHGGNYKITFRPGLPAQIGEVLEAPVVLCDLYPGPPAVGALHRRQLRAAGDGAAVAFRSSRSI